MTDTSKLRETPETDYQAFRPCKHCVDHKINCVPADFARTLERQRDELAERIRRSLTDISNIRPTPKADAFMAQWVNETHQCFDASIADFSRTLERQRDELAEALRYWLPDEVDATDQVWNAWNKHTSLLAKIEGERE